MEKWSWLSTVHHAKQLPLSITHGLSWLIADITSPLWPDQSDHWFQSSVSRIMQLLLLISVTNQWQSPCPNMPFLDVSIGSDLFLAVRHLSVSLNPPQCAWGQDNHRLSSEQVGYSSSWLELINYNRSLVFFHAKEWPGHLTPVWLYF